MYQKFINDTMYHVWYMTQQVASDGWVNVKIRTQTMNEIKIFMKNNSIFESQAQVVEYAIRQLLERAK